MEDLCLVATCLLTSGGQITDPTLPEPSLTLSNESISQSTLAELHLLSDLSLTTQSVDVELEPELSEPELHPRLSESQIIDFSDSNTAILEPIAPVGQVAELFEAMPEFSPELGLEQIEFSEPEPARIRFTSVAELSDVQSSDWAFQSLQSLVKQYRCLDGYPDITFRENRPLSRHEFAAALNACLEYLDETSQRNAIAQATQADLEMLQRLRQDFAAELATLHDLHDQLDRLEARTATLDANQFSTTTSLRGTVNFALVNAFSEDSDLNPTFGQRVTLTLNTSFTGDDQLKTRLRAGNITRLDRATDFNEPRLSFDTNTDSEVKGSVSYRFPLGDNVEIGTGINVSTATDVINPFLASSSSGALSRFGQRNPIYRVTTNTNVGIAASIDLSNAVSLSFGYSTEVAANPNNQKGLFNGNYGVLGQLTLRPSDQLELGLTYVHSYSAEGRGIRTRTGSQAASLTKLGPLKLERPVVGNSFGIEASYDINDHFTLGGWVGYTAARVIGLGEADIWNWAVTLAFPDLGRSGNLGGVIVGMQPRLTGVSQGLRAIGQLPDNDIGLHVEAFYRHEVNQNISITPGIIWLTAPDHNNDNADIAIATIRTVFRF